MVQNNSYQVTVKSATDLAKPRVYFARIVNDADDQFDINVVLRALRMLFNSDQFKICVETYGAWVDVRAGHCLLHYFRDIILTLCLVDYNRAGWLLTH